MGFDNNMDIEDMDDIYDDDDQQEYYKRMQAMINDGSVWKLEGSMGRAAMELITAGICILGEAGHYDYWNNYVPSRFEVKAGTKGSIEYQQTVLN